MSLQPRHSVLRDALNAKGFQYNDDVIHIFAGGSNQHGARLEDNGDLDICGVYLEPAIKQIGIDVEQHFVTSTSKQGERNTADDVDYNMYTLRKWAQLASKGNPTVLSYLFMPWVDYRWQKVQDCRPAFLASKHARNFIGFGRNQLKRMMNPEATKIVTPIKPCWKLIEIEGPLGQGKHGRRNELIDKFGYDTKAAMHMIRMMLEGLELVRTGRMTFPNPDVDLLLAIRQGQFSKHAIAALYEQFEAELFEAEQKSDLPRSVDRETISELITEIYLEHWSEDDLPMPDPHIVAEEWRQRNL